MVSLIFQSGRISEGYLILFSGLVIVFTALLLLSLFFKFGLPALLYLYKVISKGPDQKIQDIKITPNRSFTGEEAAAISAAIHLYLSELHDEENPILTIKQAKKTYSPWSSKIYSTHNRIGRG